MNEKSLTLLVQVMESLKELLAVCICYFNQQPETIKDKYLRTKEVMAIFSIDAKTLYTWKRKGTVKFKKIGGTVYFRESDIIKLLNDRNEDPD